VNVYSISRALARVREEEATLLDQLDLARSRLRFDCGCGKRHAIKDCVLIQSHWYEDPHGCTGGDTWHTGEMAIICPDTDHKNRLFFDSKNKVDYEHRNWYDYSAELQFRRLYLHLFKDVVDDYDKDRRSWWINRYFDNNRKRFGLRVQGLDK
jgi:hypothetical protein